MTEKLQLPNPAPKGREHEKWKAMVDSVIEFIAASRTMLHVLNERVRESERFKEEEKKRLEDEKTKLAFYKECLHVEIKQKMVSKSATTDPIIVEKTPFLIAREGGDVNVENTNEKIYSDAHRGIELVREHGDKLLCGHFTEVNISNDIQKIASVPKLQNPDGDAVKNYGGKGHIDHHQQTTKNANDTERNVTAHVNNNYYHQTKGDIIVSDAKENAKNNQLATKSTSSDLESDAKESLASPIKNTQLATETTTSDLLSYAEESVATHINNYQQTKKVNIIVSDAKECVATPIKNINQLATETTSSDLLRYAEASVATHINNNNYFEQTQKDNITVSDAKESVATSPIKNNQQAINTANSDAVSCAAGKVEAHTNNNQQTIEVSDTKESVATSPNKINQQATKKTADLVTNNAKGTGGRHICPHQHTPRTCKRGLSKVSQNEVAKTEKNVRSSHQQQSKCQKCLAKHNEEKLSLINEILSETPSKQNAAPEPIINASVEIQSTIVTEQVSIDIQSLPTEEDIGTSVEMQCTSDKDTANSFSETEGLLITCEEATGEYDIVLPPKKDFESSTIDLIDTKSSASSPIPKPMPPHQSGSKLVKCTKVSKIPRTKSFADGKVKCTVIERSPTEGACIGRPLCTKKTPKESYRHIYQRNKTSK